MGEDVFAARPDLLVDVADDVLGWSLRDVCAAGPEDDLTRTDRAQPALYAVAYALWEAFAAAAAAPAAAAGHSLGEYTALAAAGALDYAAGLRLVAARGAAMANAAGQVDSGMAALIGADEDAAETLVAACRSGGGALWVANLNAPGQVVIAGATTDIEWASDHAAEFGVRRVIPLKVAGAFHSPLMAPATADLEASLSATHLGEPRFAVWANADAAPVTDPADALRRQLTSPVRFAASLEGMAASGIDTFVHIGPGEVTAGLARRTVPGAAVHVVATLEDVPAVAAVVQ